MIYKWRKRWEIDLKNLHLIIGKKQINMLYQSEKKDQLENIGVKSINLHDVFVLIIISYK